MAVLFQYGAVDSQRGIDGMTGPMSDSGSDSAFAVCSCLFLSHSTALSWQSLDALRTTSSCPRSTEGAQSGMHSSKPMMS